MVQFCGPSGGRLVSSFLQKRGFNLPAGLAAMALPVGSRPFPLPRHSRSQETKWCSVCHLLISQPASLRIVVAVMMPSIGVGSVPVRRNNSVRKSNCGAFPFFFLSRSFRFSSADWHLGSDPLFAGDTAQAGDRTWPSACDKTRNHPVPVSAQAADLLASCPRDSARSAPGSPSPANHGKQPAYGSARHNPSHPTLPDT